VFITQNFVSFLVFEQFELQDTFRRLNLVMKERDKLAGGLFMMASVFPCH